MARKRKQQAPRPTEDAPRKEDPLQALEHERARLEEVLRKKKFAANEEAGNTVFWGALGSVGFLCDIAFLGGFGTTISVLAGAGWIKHGADARKMQKDLKTLDRKIIDLKEMRAQMHILREEDAALRRQEMKADFSAAALSEIEALRRQVADLQARLEPQEPPKKRIEKPKYDPPA